MVWMLLDVICMSHEVLCRRGCSIHTQHLNVMQEEHSVDTHLHIRHHSSMEFHSIDPAQVSRSTSIVQAINPESLFVQSSMDSKPTSRVLDILNIVTLVQADGMEIGLS